MTESPKPSRSNVRRWVERLLLLTGSAALGIWAGSQVIPAIWQAYQSRSFDLAVKNAPAKPATQTIRPASPSAPEKHAGPHRPPDGSVLGRLSIPRLQLSSMVREGDDDATLSLALGHIPSTSLPGDNGNVGIAGHRDTLFRGLKDIKRDDLIRFETISGAHVYQVDKTSVVQPNDVDVLKPGPNSELTLVTCYPFHYIGPAPQRFIVSAHELSPSEVQEAAKPVSPPAPVNPTPVRAPASVVPAVAPAASKTTGARTETVSLLKSHSQQIATGLSIGISDADESRGRADGWIWVLPDRRSVLFKNQAIGEPLVFTQDGKRCELMITSVTRDRVTASLLLDAE